MLVSESVKTCNKCHEKLPVSQFHKDAHTSDGYRYTCKACRNRLLNEYRGQVSTWGERAYKTRYRANSKGWDHDLTAEFLEDLWNQQQGLCFYTGYAMNDRLGKQAKRDPYAVSIDRVHSDKGYTKDNVVLCCTQANTMKNDLTLDDLQNWYPVWYAKIINKFGG